MSGKTVIAICGPTAAGKTDLAIRLALKYKTAVLSADSRQCFSELNIGVAKPSADQLHTVRHYFVNYCSIAEDVTAGTFERYGLEVANKVFAHHDYLIMAGGTGLYVKAFLEGIDEIPMPDKGMVDQIKTQYIREGIQWLAKELKREDHLFAERGEMKNPHRMIRALVVKLSTGKSILSFQRDEKAKRDFSIRKVFIDLPRQLLYDRINERVDKMVESGLVEEAEKFIPQRDLKALQTVGYQELFDYFDGHISLPDAISLIKRNTRHYAKRQLTWFKKYFTDDRTEIIGS